MAIESLEKSTENLGKSIGEIFDAKNRYIIPLYQRNYAWGEAQIEALIQDIYEARMSDTDKYYIGSFVVLKRCNGDYEVVDGLTDIVDCLGNLFMISKNANSRLSDRDVKEKVEMSKDANMGANRQIIYQKTKDNDYNWGEKEIKVHYDELRVLLGKKDDLLNIQ